MSDQFAAVTNKQAYKYSTNSGSDLGSKIKELDDISCVAVGKNTRYAIVSSRGGYSVVGPQKLKDKLAELYRDDYKTKNIKHISFGPRDCWAIIMKNGWCYCWAPERVLSKINDHNGSISYVSMTSSDDRYIVGWGRNGWWGSVCDSLKGYLNGVNACNKEIKVVELGYNNHYFVHSEGNFHYATNYNSWFNGLSASNITVGLW